MAAIDKIINFRLPSYTSLQADWEKWRLTYKGGVDFRDMYLEKFTTRESDPEFNERRRMTPIPSFAKSAMTDIRNSIFQRLIDIERRGGSKAYHEAVDGDRMGVNRRGSTMNGFIGQKVLEDLLVMGKVGVFVDAPSLPAQPTLAQTDGFRPYLYMYKVEDILSYACTLPDEPSQFQSLLLRDRVLKYDETYGLPSEKVARFRFLWINEGTGKVWCQFYDTDGNPVDRNMHPGGPTELKLTRIPFVLMDIGDSLIRDVCEHQIALVNLGSSDVNYSLKAGFPFYTEQRDLKKVGGHLKRAANPNGTATAGGQGAHDSEIRVGATQGRAYDLGTDRPKFINPSSEPLEASMKLQDKLERDIRKLVNLAVASLGKQSAEAKKVDNEGLEAGLSFIGLALEAGEKQIAEHWAAYENTDPKRRTVARVKYPETYTLKTDSDRIDESDKLTKVIRQTPSRTAQKELWKTNIVRLLGGHVKPGVLEKINKEIDESKFTTADPETIDMAVERGLCGEKTGSIALGFDENEYLQAREDHTARIKRIAETQGVVDKAPINNDARGVVDLDDGSGSAADEKAESRDNTLQSESKDRTRGKGRKVTGGS